MNVKWPYCLRQVPCLKAADLKAMNHGGFIEDLARWIHKPADRAITHPPASYEYINGDRFFGGLQRKIHPKVQLNVRSAFCFKVWLKTQAEPFIENLLEEPQTVWVQPFKSEAGTTSVLHMVQAPGWLESESENVHTREFKRPMIDVWQALVRGW